VQLGLGKAEVRLGGSGRTCCTGFAGLADSVRRRIGSFACSRMQRVGLLALVAVALGLAVAAVDVVYSYPRISAALAHRAQETCLSQTSVSSVVQTVQ
jgi:hypothetical protein